jgi:hypothetical protein
VALGLKALLLARFGAGPGQRDEWGAGVLPMPALPVDWQPHKLAGALLVGCFCVAYAGLTWVAGIPQAKAIAARLLIRR